MPVLDSQVTISVSLFGTCMLWLDTDSRACRRLTEEVEICIFCQRDRRLSSRVNLGMARTGWFTVSCLSAALLFSAKLGEFDGFH